MDSSVSDHWAAKRKLFKENKQWSSAGGSSITSDMTEEQGLGQPTTLMLGLVKKQIPNYKANILDRDVLFDEHD